MLSSLAVATECGSIRGTAAQISHLVDVVNSPEVQAIRAGINEMRAGCTGGCKVTEPMAIDDLKKVEKPYLASKFSVFSGEPFLGGGRMVRVLFQDKPDAFFDAWVKQGPEPGHWYLLSFRKVENPGIDMVKLKCDFAFYLSNADLNI
jgi:hypothetical protein